MGTIAAPAEPRLRDLEGHRVNVTLADGVRLDGVTVVSAGRGRVTSVWLDVDGIDVFINRSEVMDARRPTDYRAA